jgi:hypothetical protein
MAALGNDIAFRNRPPEKPDPRSCGSMALFMNLSVSHINICLSVGVFNNTSDKKLRFNVYGIQSPLF